MSQSGWYLQNSGTNHNLRFYDYYSSTSIIGENGTYLTTPDGGNNWTNIMGVPYTPTSIFFVNANQGWSSHNYRIMYTSNSGVNWIEQHYNNSNYYRDIFFVNEFEGWACGSYGTIVHTSTGGIGINKISTEIPESFKLYQNYPNPFNPVTKIRFDLPHDSRLRGNDNVMLKVYDILGREIAALVNQQLQPGTYEVDFDGTNFASGVYLYSIRAGEFIQSRKMVLIK